ncbi:MAG TPA: hypothetical protein VJT31_15440 [Rugosimonospora sp.]|nr:hypothetical protein [Rugosimonospora sp.]
MTARTLGEAVRSTAPKLSAGAGGSNPVPTDRTLLRQAALWPRATRKAPGDP